MAIIFQKNIIRHSHGYQRAQIPRGAATSRLNPHISMYKKQIGHKCPSSQGRQRRRRDFPRDCRDSCPSYPRARRTAHRYARRRVSTAPVTERLHTSLANRSHAPPRSTPVRTNRTACEKLSQLKKSTAPQWNGLHSNCRCTAQPCMLPLRQPSLPLLLGWPPV
jgi:hypothetical protein